MNSTQQKLSKIVKTKEAYIIFGGPSLRNFDFSKLDGKFTLGCNRAAIEYHCSAVITADPIFLNHNISFLKNYNGYTIVSDRETYNNGETRAQKLHPNYYYRHCKKEPGLCFNGRDLYGFNTGHVAINFAVLQGFKIIHALGLDMNVTGHWHDGYSWGRQQMGTLEMWAKYIDKLKPTLDDLGVTMINYNPVSAVRAYKFGDKNEIS